MPDEVDRRLDEIESMAVTILRGVDAIRAARRVNAQEKEEKRKRRHLHPVAWIGGLGIAAAVVREFAGQNRAAFAGVAIGAVGMGGAATIACQDHDGLEARPKVTIEAPAPNAPWQSPPPSKPSKVPPSAAPSPSPTQIPNPQIPTTPIPTTFAPIATEPGKTKPGKTKAPRPENTHRPTRPPNTHPPVVPPGQTGGEGETLDECIFKVWIGDLHLLNCPES